MKSLILSAALAGALGTSGAAFAEQGTGVKVGTLTCSEAAGWGWVVGSSRSVACVFSNGDRTERYEGAINKLGADIGYKSSAKIVWAVIAPTDQPKQGALAGAYVGGTASATVGVGVGANVLVGGFQRSISLQPLSVEGNEGLNVAAGIGELTLRAAHE